MPELKPMSDMHGVVDEKSAKEYISVIAKNVADQITAATMIAVEWGIDASYVTMTIALENERAKKDTIFECLKHLASHFAIDADSDDPEDEEDV